MIILRNFMDSSGTTRKFTLFKNMLQVVKSHKNFKKSLLEDLMRAKQLSMCIKYYKD